MNYFETKKVKLYSQVNDYYGNSIGETDNKLRYVCDLMVDIQPATAKLLEKEFGSTSEATYILWAETLPSKDIVINKDMYVRFEYENYENLYQVVDRSRWLGNDEFFDDYTSFSVKLVLNNKLEEVDYTNEPIMASLEQPTINATLPKPNNNEDNNTEKPGDDYYG